MPGTPYVLSVRAYEDDGSLGPESLIDLDDPGWKDTYAAALARPGRWVLASKRPREASIILHVEEGETARYVARHVGSLNDTTREIICYGLVKDLPDGTEQSVWAMPGGAVVIGDDVYRVGADIVNGRLR